MVEILERWSDFFTYEHEQDIRAEHGIGITANPFRSNARCPPVRSQKWDVHATSLPID
jgi:hypothetical protein